MVCFPIRSLTPVYSSQLDWDPKGDQAETMSQAPPRAVNSDIVIAKMAPGQVCIQRLILTPVSYTHLTLPTTPYV